MTAFFQFTPKSTEQQNTMTLSELVPGQSAKITLVSASPVIRQRILDMGLIPGVTVRMERKGPMGHPYWIGCNGTSLALRQEEALGVEAELLKD